MCGGEPHGTDMKSCLYMSFAILLGLYTTVLFNSRGPGVGSILAFVLQERISLFLFILFKHIFKWKIFHSCYDGIKCVKLYLTITFHFCTAVVTNENSELHDDCSNFEHDIIPITRAHFISQLIWHVKNFSGNPSIYKVFYSILVSLVNIANINF